MVLRQRDPKLTLSLGDVTMASLPLRKSDLRENKERSRLCATRREPLLLLKLHLHVRPMVEMGLQEMNLTAHWRAGAEPRPLGKGWPGTGLARPGKPASALQDMTCT